jgi:protein gp37
MGDLFHDDITDAQISSVFSIMVNCPQHTFVLCTKRPERIIEFFKYYQNYISNKIGSNYRKYEISTSFKNIWFGCSIEDCKTLHERVPTVNRLHETYGLHTWISFEPLLEDVSERLKIVLDINPNFCDGFIVGGESGTGARYCDPKWIVEIYMLCRDNNINFYFKQFGTNKQNVNIPGLNMNEVGYICKNWEIIKHNSIINTKNLPWKENK